MDDPIIYIGIAQSLFTSLVVLLKRPLKIADIILAVLLILISGIFFLNLFKKIYGIEGDVWIVSLPLSMTFPPTLYLYSKYVSAVFNRFKRTDLLHYLPLLAVMFVIFLNMGNGHEDVIALIDHFNKQVTFKNITGGVFVITLWIYGVLTIRNIIQYRRQIPNIYSYKSDRINLTWLLIVAISFLLVFSINVIVSTLHHYDIITMDINQLRNLAQLIFVYILGLWGFRQNQLISDMNHVELNKKQVNLQKTDSLKYQKSGLTSEKADEYLDRLISFMNKSEAWKDNKLSVEKLSFQTDIPKHHITQVLNENLGKNFYVFVNEYRIECAKKLILSPETSSWSFVAVAYECGFNSKTAFNNFFKKYTGHTPSGFKSINE